jgi:hypothetical protein
MMDMPATSAGSIAAIGSAECAVVQMSAHAPKPSRDVIER